MKHSYYNLYNMHYKKGAILFIITFFVSVSIIISYLVKIYNSYNTYGIYYDGYVYVDIPIANSDAVNMNNYIKIDNKKYYNIKYEITDLKVQGGINYQTYEININKKYKDNEVVQITFYYNKQRIIQKIIHIIF